MNYKSNEYYTLKFKNIRYMITRFSFAKMLVNRFTIINVVNLSIPLQLLLTIQFVISRRNTVIAR